jgi:hypothetical protein
MMKRTYTKYVLSPLAEAVINALFPGFMLGCLHLILTYSGFYLNSGWWWIDVPLHLTGGACVAFAAGSLIAYAVKIKKFPPQPWYFFILSVIGVVAIVGLVWEFYEFLADAFYPVILRQADNADTMKDLANDLNGGLILVLISKRHFDNILTRPNSKPR